MAISIGNEEIRYIIAHILCLLALFPPYNVCAVAYVSNILLAYTEHRSID